MGVCAILQIVKPDGLARGEVLDLAEVADPVGAQHDAAECEKLASEKGTPTTDGIVDPKTIHCWQIRRLSFPPLPLQWRRKAWGALAP